MRRRMLGAVLACGLAVGLVGSTRLQGQDLQTQLALFLNDLFAGTLGVTKPLTSLKLTSGANVSTLTGTGAGSISLTGTTPIIQYGGTTSSFPAWKQVSATLQARLADDSANTAITASFYNGNASSILASASTIAPTGNLHHISGTTAIVTITVPAGCTPTCQITLIPDGLWTTTAAGNISLASTAVVNKALILAWDGTKWNPSY